MVVCDVQYGMQWFNVHVKAGKSRFCPVRHIEIKMTKVPKTKAQMTDEQKNPNIMGTEFMKSIR